MELLIFGIFQLLIILGFLISAIAHLFNNSKLKGIFNVTEVLSYAGFVICLLMEYELKVLFEHKHYGWNSFDYYAITLITLFVIHLLERMIFKQNELLTKVALPINGALLILSVITTIYILPQMALSIFPFFGVLMVVPLFFSIVIGNYTVKKAKEFAIKNYIKPHKSVLLTLVGGLILLILFQAFFSLIGDEKAALIDVFIDHGSFGMKDFFFGWD